jgi:predicted ATPase/DNA-binding winged helix-turn-helix (wHTH) protein
MTPPATEWAVRFGPFRLYPQQRVLLEHDRPVRLGSRAFDILATLIAHAGTTVTKADLMARVWPDTVVEEANLRVHVAALRKALRDGAGRRYIDSVAGRGYTFIAPVSGNAPAAAASFERPAAACAATLPACPPPPAGPLVGRADAVAAVARQLTAQRLVTLAGTGGVGKTALALTVARQLAAQLPCCAVDLAAAPDAGAVPAVLAAALGLPAGPDPLPSVLACLRARPLLLLLDNCERVVDAVAALAERLLQEAPRLNILATSREALRAADERVIPLAPLDCPAPDAGLPALLAAPAVTLFLYRAGIDGATLSEADAAAVARICRRVDGIPLALELAAGRLDLFHVRELATLMDDPLHLLKGGRRTAPPRHRSWRASLAWSWDTLTPVEQTVLCRLAVPRGEFGLATASRIAADGMLDAAGVEDAVAALHAKSLLAARHTEDGLRCRLVAGAREYALALAENVENAGDATPVRCAVARPGLPIPARAPLPRGGKRITTRTA